MESVKTYRLDFYPKTRLLTIWQGGFLTVRRYPIAELAPDYSSAD